LLDGLALASAEPSAPRRGARPAPRTPTWIWTVAHFESPFARLLVAGSPEEPWLAANVSGENLGPGAYWSPVRAWIDWGAGTAVFDGTARMTRGFLLEGRVTASDIDAVAVARAVGPPLATLVQAGRAAADLNVELAFGEAKDQPLDFRGKVDATVPPLDLRGRITVADLWLAGPDPSAFAFGARALDLELARVAPAKDGSRQLEIGFASAALESPYLTLTRTAEEAAVDVAAAPAPAAPADAMPAVTLAVADVRARNGRLLVVDEVATPHLALDLATIDGWGRELRLPALGMGEFVVQGSDRRLGALRLAGALGRGDLVGELSAPAVNLTAVSPYLQRARLPYVFTSGTGAVRSHVAFAGHYWSADTTVTLVEPTLGGDAGVLEQSLGMPAAAAFDELRERHGEVSLRVPLGSAGWAGGRWLNEMVASAMREALARPRLAPLPEAPIGFAAGRTEAGPQAGRQLAAIADALAARPNVVVEVRGAISSDDRRWFAEQALGAEDTDEPRGISGWLRAVGFRGQHDRIRDALAARAAGRPGRLDSADEAALRDLVAARPPIADERLTSLAAERATLVANALADRHGVDAERVVVATTQTETEALAPVVEVRFRPRPEPAPW
jgi:hypothetical protein